MADAKIKDLQLKLKNSLSQIELLKLALSQKQPSETLKEEDGVVFPNGFRIDPSD